MDSSDQSHVERWYAPLGDTLSQGDVVDIVPTGLIDAPLTICQPHNKDETGKANYAPFDKGKTRRGVEFIHAKGSVERGLIIWPDCQVDKLKNQGRPEKEWFVGVAAVHPIERLNESLRERVRSLNRAQFFPLPAHETLSESYVDLRYIWPIRYSLLSKRMISLSTEARAALSFHLFWFMTEVRVAEHVPCPHCAEPIGSNVFFQFKDAGEAEG